MRSPRPRRVPRSGRVCRPTDRRIPLPRSALALGRRADPYEPERRRTGRSRCQGRPDVAKTRKQLRDHGSPRSWILDLRMAVAVSEIHDDAARWTAASLQHHMPPVHWSAAVREILQRLHPLGLDLVEQAEVPSQMTRSPRRTEPPAVSPTEDESASPDECHCGPQNRDHPRRACDQGVPACRARSRVRRGVG